MCLGKRTGRRKDTCFLTKNSWSLLKCSGDRATSVQGVWQPLTHGVVGRASGQRLTPCLLHKSLQKRFGLQLMKHVTLKSGIFWRVSEMRHHQVTGMEIWSWGFAESLSTPFYTFLQQKGFLLPIGLQHDPNHWLQCQVIWVLRCVIRARCPPPLSGSLPIKGER